MAEDKLYRVALREALTEEMQRDDRVYLIGEDIGKTARRGQAPSAALPHDKVTTPLGGDRPAKPGDADGRDRG
jgi:pyruvate/2-oxoglutarate/acetoin dehydrogenase E1 component